MFQKNIDHDIEVRLADESDYADYVALLSEEDPRGAESEAAWKVSGNLEQVTNREIGFEFAILFRGELAGTIRFKAISWDWKNRRANVGYQLARRFRGQGIMTRALSGALDIVYQQLDFDRIEIDGDVRNVKSEAVAKRLGFKLEGITRHAMWEDGHPVDFWIYSMLAGEWYSATSRHC